MVMAPTTPPGFRNTKQARIKRRLETEADAGQRFHGVHQVLLRGQMKRSWGVIRTIRRGPQSPNSAIILGAPLAWSTYQSHPLGERRSGYPDSRSPTSLMPPGVTIAGVAISGPPILQLPHRHYEDPGPDSPSQLISLSPSSSLRSLFRLLPSACPRHPWAGSPWPPAKSS